MKTLSSFGRILVGWTIAFTSLGVLAAAEPVFDGLGSYSRKITTASPKAQRYFNQGLGFYHGFNHGAAIRAFKEAARIDPKCAMAHWGSRSRLAANCCLSCSPYRLNIDA